MRLRADLPVELIQHVGSDAMIAAAARVSTGADREADYLDLPAYKRNERDHGLLDYLLRNRHGTPFEHGSVTFRIEAPIFVAREAMRHRVGWSYNETSGRYRELEMDFYMPLEGRPLRQVGRVGHYEFVPGGMAEREAVVDSLMTAYGSAERSYRHMLDAGVAKEVARAALPVGVYTSWYATANPRSVMHFLSLRTKEEDSKFPSYPQYEMEKVARGIEGHFADLYPNTYSAFVKHGRVAP